MANKHVEEAVIAALRKLGCDVDQVLPVQELEGDLGVDSTEMVELAALVRTDCGLTIENLNLRGVQQRSIR